MNIYQIIAVAGGLAMAVFTIGVIFGLLLARRDGEE